jgi:chromosome segregation ATPase
MIAVADEPENLTLKLLREMRAEMREGFEKSFGELAELRQGFVELRGSVYELQIALTATRVDVAAIKTDVETIRETQQNQGARLNAIDGRLALIERHTGLVKA